MEGIIPRHKTEGVDFCGSKDCSYIIRSDLGCYMMAKDLNKGSGLSIHALHPSCQHGDHYFADTKRFYIIKGDEYRRVTDLSEGTDSITFTLDSNYQNGDHYLSAFDKFYIIFQGKGIYRRTSDLSKDSYSEEFPLHLYCRYCLYYWGDKDQFYFLKQTSEWGVEYYKWTDLSKNKPTAVYSVHPDILNFLPGGLSITSGPAFRKWVKIKTVINDSPTPVTWTKKITKKVGYKKEKMSQITHNWKIETSTTITSGKLARLIANGEFTLSGEYGGARVNTEMENWTEETEDEEQLSFELMPNVCLYVWQYQLGLGSEPVLFCRDLKITGPALMEAADLLCKSLFHWLENRNECAKELLELEQELEDHQRKNTAQGSGALALVCAAALTTVCPTSTLIEAGLYSTTFDKAIELIKEDEKVGTSIQEQLRDLKDRCGDASLRAHVDELDCEVTTQLMLALARSRMTPGGPAAAEVSDFICQALRLDSFPEITIGLKVSPKEIVKNIELIGIKASAKAGSEGTIGLGISLRDLIVKSERANRIGIMKASKLLRESARQILEGQQKLKEQLDVLQYTVKQIPNFTENNSKF